VATPGVAGEMREVSDAPRPEGVQVDVAHEFLEVGILLHHDGLVPVLEEMPVPLVPAVEVPGIPGEEAPHEGGKPVGATPEKKVGVVGQEGPGVKRRPCGGRGRA